MEREVSKSSFKARALALFREVQETGEGIVITDHGRPVLRLVPYRHNPEQLLRGLRGSVLRYDAPEEPVALEDWDLLK